jgi:hypothetical protein
VGAAGAEHLAPLAARVRRALGLDGTPGLRGTSDFEDAITAVLADAPAGARARVVELGRRCPAAPILRTMPTPTCSRAPG